jgi:hypothetical protein
MTRSLDFASAPTSGEAQKVALGQSSHLVDDFDEYHYSSTVTACYDAGATTLRTSVIFYVLSSQSEIENVHTTKYLCR